MIKAPPRTSARTRRRLPSPSSGTVATAGIIALVALAWQIAALVTPTAAEDPSPLIPGWGWLLHEALPQMGQYAEPPDSPETSYAAAFNTLASHSLVTLLRLGIGVVVGWAGGVGLALLISWSKVARLLIAVPANVLKALPLLAMIPLFQLWFGVSEKGIFALVSFGIGIIMFSGTLSAVTNVPRIYGQYAMTLGATPFTVYRTVVLRAIVPEVRTAAMVSLGVAWTAVTGAEFLGTQRGLGFIEAQAKQFGLLDRMAIVAILFVVFAAVVYAVFVLITRPLVAWVGPREDS